MALSAVPWFRATQLTLLVVLMFFHFATFTMQPVLPPGARLFIDDGKEPVQLKRGDTLSFTLRSHTAKVLPREGQERLPTGEEIRGYQFTITPKDLLFHTYRGRTGS